MYAANKYMYPQLTTVVVNQLIKWISTSKENVFDVFEKVEKFKIEKLDSFILEMIQTNTCNLLDYDSFLNIRKSTLKFLLSQPKLNISELELFNACLRWARAQCGRNEIAEPRPDELREAFGDLLYLIRIFSFTTKSFICNFCKSGIFTSDEVVKVLLHLESNQDSTDDFIAKFNPNNRLFCGAKWVKFFTEVCHGGSLETARDFISRSHFSFEDVVNLQGFAIEKKDCRYCEIKDLIVKQDSKILFSRKEIYSKEGTYEIIFDLPVAILQDIFTIQFTIRCCCKESSKKYSGTTNVLTARNQSIFCKFNFDIIPSCLYSVSLFLY